MSSDGGRCPKKLRARRRTPPPRRGGGGAGSALLGPASVRSESALFSMPRPESTLTVLARRRMVLPVVTLPPVTASSHVGAAGLRNRPCCQTGSKAWGAWHTVISSLPESTFRCPPATSMAIAQGASVPSSSPNLRCTRASRSASLRHSLTSTIREEPFSAMNLIVVRFSSSSVGRPEPSAEPRRPRCSAEVSGSRGPLRRRLYGALIWATLVRGPNAPRPTA